MSLAVNEACDAIVALGTLDHEYGIPKIWPRARLLADDLDLEDEYYRLNQELAHELDQLVNLSKTKELQELSPESIAEQFEEIQKDEYLSQLSLQEAEHFLQSHRDNFKTTALLNDYLTLALPVLRAIYHGNSSLADSEFTVLNNLKKLYSQYNDHPANISRLIQQYEKQNALLAEDAAILAQIEHLYSTSIARSMKELHELNQEYLVLQNTYGNQVQSQSDASAQAPSEQRKVRVAVSGLAKRVSSVSVLCDLLPNLILCQPSNWYNDETLRAIVEDCQDTSEKLVSAKGLSVRTIRGIGIDEILKMDFQELAEALRPADAEE